MISKGEVGCLHTPELGEAVKKVSLRFIFLLLLVLDLTVLKKL